MIESASLLEKEKEKYSAVTKEDIQQKAQELFAPGKKNKLVYLSKN
jgi:hypothetical protein